MATLGKLVRGLFGGIGRMATDRPLSYPALIDFARSIRFYLTAGMTLRDAMTALGEKGTWDIRGVAQGLARDLASGWSFQSALEKQGRRFPPLFVSLAVVGEETGKLPEVMRDLEKYYDLQVKQRQKLLGESVKPIIQFVLAVGVVALLIYMLSVIPQPKDKFTARVEVDAAGQTRTVIDKKDMRYDVVGLGLFGAPGAIAFVVIVLGTAVGVVVVFRLLRRLLSGTPVFDRIILAVPFVGSCVKNLAITRFSFAMQLMLDSSMSILKTIRMAYAATDNAAFALCGPKAEGLLRRGNSVVSALEVANLFPRSFMSAAAVGEETGHLPEVMQNQAEYFDERSQRQIATLYAILGYAVWAGVAGLIAFMVLRLFTVFYGGALDEATSMVK